MTKTKQITKIVAVIMIAFCILSVPKAVHAARVDNICYQWDEISQTSNYGVLHYNTNEKYKTIRYLHGYKTSNHKNNITSWTDRLGGIYSRIQHTLSITTY
ncbi:hypothetical protein [Inconstantimicrobium porci]|uniref:Uncharacterized protein n=1 Tax=Inconstantimicrobium porci TaxID=2652291 RepID=A0A7X2T2F3_9CLOT|nr:hypothetical protein [Inconstantimicrobium porci]MSR91863.1 hypothetical protein [Inconstantimicrobium porci]